MADCATGDCDSPIFEGFHISVYDEATGCCSRRLRRANDISSPSIPYQSTATEVDLRDGSVAHPIKLPALQTVAGTSVPALLVVLADGSLGQWKAVDMGCGKKIIADNGSFKIVDDLSSDLFKGTICDADCGDTEGALGWKTVTMTCPGKADIQVTQICKIPACCCAASDDEDCTSCDAIEAFRNT